MQKAGVGKILSGFAIAVLDALFPKKSGKVVVHSSPDFDDGARAVIQELQARGINTVVLCEQDQPASRVTAILGFPLKAIHKNSYAGRYHYLTAEAVITTHGVYRSHPIPKRQKMIYIGHGEPLSKSTGHWDRIEPPLRPTVAITMSPIGTAFRSVEFGVPPESVFALGAPRNDRMLNASRSQVRKAALDGDDHGQHLLLSLPTYREHRLGVRTDGAPYPGPLPLNEEATRTLEAWLEANDTVLLNKKHPLSPTRSVRPSSRIREVDSAWFDERQLSLYSLMAGIDCLITDVSSVWTDFLLTERPMIFLFPDIDSYRTTRHINLEPFDRYAAGPLVSTVDELIEQLGTIDDGQQWVDKRKFLTGLLHSHVDGQSAKRVVDAVL